MNKSKVILGPILGVQGKRTNPEAISPPASRVQGRTRANPKTTQRRPLRLPSPEAAILERQLANMSMEEKVDMLCFHVAILGNEVGDLRDEVRNLCDEVSNLGDKLGVTFENSLRPMIVSKLRDRGIESSFPVNHVCSSNDPDWGHAIQDLSRLLSNAGYRALSSFLPFDKQQKLCNPPPFVEFNLLSFTHRITSAFPMFRPVNADNCEGLCIVEATTARLPRRCMMQAVFGCKGWRELRRVIPNQETGPIEHLLYKLLQLERQVTLASAKYTVVFALLVDPHFQSADSLTHDVFRHPLFQGALAGLYAVYQQGGFALTSLNGFEFQPP